jgi:DNA polymerase-3 subunit gamma/tau
MYYLKYRPEKFADFIKPNPEIETIQNQIIKGNTGHAYILSGSRGIGKTSTARLIAKALNCTNFNGDVCNECENCVSIKSGGFVDVIEIDGASNRGIDEARSLRESLKFSPLRGSKKVYIIDEVHMSIPLSKFSHSRESET